MHSEDEDKPGQGQSVGWRGQRWKRTGEKPHVGAFGWYLAGTCSVEARVWNAFVDRSEDRETWLNRNFDFGQKHHHRGGVIQPALWESKRTYPHAAETSAGKIGRSDSRTMGLPGHRWS